MALFSKHCGIFFHVVSRPINGHPPEGNLPGTSVDGFEQAQSNLTDLLRNSEPLKITCRAWPTILVHKRHIPRPATVIPTSVVIMLRKDQIYKQSHTPTISHSKQSPSPNPSLKPCLELDHPIPIRAANRKMHLAKESSFSYVHTQLRGDQSP